MYIERDIYIYIYGCGKNRKQTSRLCCSKLMKTDICVVQVAVRAVPYHNNFLTMLGSDGTPDGNAAVTVHMADFARSLGEINDIINQFYQLHKLDTTPIL